MISDRILRRPPRRGRLFGRAPLVLACFAHRYDTHLVPALLENLEPLVHGWVALDDRASAERLSDEGQRHRLLLARARELGAGWVLAADPDERFETALAARMPDLLQAPARVTWTFDVREMWSADRYRIDGRWGSKRIGRLFALAPGQRYSTDPLHSPWHPLEPAPEFRHSELDIYHLKMIAPLRRSARRDLYAYADPGRRWQAVGYDYLADESGATFATIPAGRGYRPAHREDGGLWMAEPGP